MSKLTKWFVNTDCVIPYSYGGVTIPPEPFPDWMDDILDYVLNACGVKVIDISQRPNSCNVNFYDGQHMSCGWHSDNEPIF